MAIKLTKEQEALFKEMKSLAKLANQRILRLERNFGRNVLAIKRLQEKLEIEPLQAWTKKGRVRTSKKFNETQMRAVIKTLKSFKSSLITTKRGIKQIRKKAISSIKTEFGKETSQITEQEALALYYLFEDKEVNQITNFIPRFRYSSLN